MKIASLLTPAVGPEPAPELGDLADLATPALPFVPLLAGLQGVVGDLGVLALGPILVVVVDWRMFV
jgi:hypothetical protein